MHKLALVALVMVIGASVASFRADAAHGQLPFSGEWVSVLITLPSQAGSADERTIGQLGGSVRYKFVSSPTISVYLPKALVEQLKQYPRFADIREEPTVTALEDTVPWGIPRVGADAVWATPGAASAVSGKPAGAGVLVAVIDSGIDKTHPDLAPNIAGGRNFVRSCNWCSVNTTAWGDDNGHGTHVAGTIAASDNGNGVIGVAPKASLYAIKALNSQGSGSLGDVIAGIDHAVSVGAKVINMSLGCNCNDPALKAAVDRAQAAGVLVVAAAGNSGAGSDVGYPARYDSAVAVAATCGTFKSSYCSSVDTRASFSSTGAAVELAAPGDQILSTYRGGGFATMSGTSMATPHVAGVAALLMSCQPSLSASAVRILLSTTATDLGTPGRDTSFGYGLVSASAAAAAAGCGEGGAGDPPPPPPAPGDTTPPETNMTGNPAAVTNSQSAAFTFTSSETNSTFECAMDSTSAYSACTSPRSYSGLSNGTHTFRVRARDAANNLDSSPATFTWTIDRTAPQTTISNGAANGTATSVSFTFASSEAGSSFQCSIDSTSNYQPCSSPHAVAGLSVGSHTFRVRATDPAGNTDSTPASHTWSVTSTAAATSHAGDLDGTRTLSGLDWSARVVVTVHDANHQPVAGATVSASWSGAATGAVSGTTNSAGQVVFTRSSLSRSSSAGASIRLTISGVTKSSVSYAAAMNHDPDGDSNGTFITVLR